ncbi:hypothetical protein AMEX_G10977 [Astyanax mexicanus]|uniref:Ig-like domain-containing protein n=1 Tax=Astyanax mexicanus TaxID=7994 RepID=A0A8T2LT93_ASTMX|nr:hypothetical protein AMEX_G10977 [Astyanax mexicanus]
MFSSFFLGGSIKIDIVSQNGLNVIQDGENLKLNCSFSSSEESSTAWFKQTPGEKPLLIASAHHSNPIKYHNDFYKEDRLIALRAKNSFILGISSAEPSDSATYFCSVTYNTEHALADWTIVVLKGTFSIYYTANSIYLSTGKYNHLSHSSGSSSSLYTVLQPPVSDPVQLGGDTTLQCSILTDNSAAAWLQQTPGGKPLLIASGYHFNPVLYHNGFDKSNRFIAWRETNSFTLNISNAEPSDSATYYCAAIHYTDVAVGDYAPSSLYTVLQPPVSDPVQLGGNTTLQCSILTDNSAGDHSVYWFRHGSGESDPGIIFTHGNRSDQCKKSSETVSPTQSCIYKLPKNNLSLSDAGTYYCAVAACGEIIFGKGTKLDFEGKKIYF